MPRGSESVFPAVTVLAATRRKDSQNSSYDNWSLNVFFTKSFRGLSLTWTVDSVAFLSDKGVEIVTFSLGTSGVVSILQFINYVGKTDEFPMQKSYCQWLGTARFVWDLRFQWCLAFNKATTFGLNNSPTLKLSVWFQRFTRQAFCMSPAVYLCGEWLNINGWKYKAKLCLTLIRVIIYKLWCWLRTSKQ